MKNKIALSIVSFILASVMLFSLYSCTAAKAETVDLMENITAGTVDGKATDDTFKKAHADFSAELFKRSFDGENTLISPLSVMLALGMLGQGLSGESESELERLFGGIESEELSKYLHTYINSLPNGEKYKTDIANSVWFNDEAYGVKESYLQGLFDYYGAEAFRTPFNSDTAKKINKWVAEKTDGMIDKMLNDDAFDGGGNALMLINTLLFDAKWDEPYRETQVRDGVFTTESGNEKKVSMMYSGESIYLEDENVTGVVKPYADGKYSFVGLLPKDGVSISQLAESFDGEKITALLESASEATVTTAIPEFSYDYGLEMSDTLRSMGLERVFMPNGDFTDMFESNSGFYVSKVLHKTRIEVSPNGTKAAAATSITVNEGCAAPVEPPKEVILDRPFVYMIVDTETDLPIFIGAVTDIGE